MRKIITVTIAAALLVGPMAGRAMAADLPIQPTRHVRFTTDEATKISADLSPDGHSVVFEILGDLYVVGAIGGEARRVTEGISMDRYPRWSPDGRRICFVSDRDGTDNVWVMNADGSALRNITRQDPFERPKTVHRFLTPDWSPDGKRVIASVTTEKTILYLLEDIFEYPVDEPGEGRSVFDTAVPAEDRAGTEPQYSPDGRYIYYSRMYLNWFSAELNPPWFQIWRYDTHTKRTLPVTDRTLGAYTGSPSPDGRWLVYAGRNDADSGLRLRNLETGEDRWLLFPLDRDRVEYWTIGELSSYASWSPDSASVVTSFSGKLQRVNIATAQTSLIPFEANVDVGLGPLNRPMFSLHETERVAARAPEGVTVSPDGSRYAFAAFNRIYVAATTGADAGTAASASAGAARPLTNGRSGNEFDPVWSADGRSIVFAAFEPEAGQGNLYRQFVGGGKTRRLTSTPGFFSRPAFVPGGREIAFVRSQASESLFYRGPALVTLSRIPAAGGAAVDIGDVKQNDNSRAFPTRPQFLNRYPDRVFFNEFGSGLKSMRLDGSDLRTHLTSYPIGIQGGPVPAHGMITLSPDGSFALVRAAVPAFGAVFLADLRGYDFMAGKPLNLSNEMPKSKLVRISAALGGYAPFWSADGRVAYYSAGRRVYRVSAEAALQGMRPSLASTLDASLRRPKPSGTVLLRGARIITMKRDRVLEQGDILIEGNRIAAVEPSGVLQPAAGTHVVDMTGLTLMPGMVDAHSHQESLPYLTTPPPGQYWQNLNRVAYGVTTIVDPFHQVEQFGLADRVAAGLSLGPRMYGAGPGFTENEFMYSLADAQEITTRQSEIFGERILKNYNTGGRITRQWLVEAAQQAGLIAVYETDGNLHKSLSAILDGYSHLAHGFALPLYKDMTTLLAQSGTGVCYQFGTLRGEGGPSSIYYFYDHSLAEEVAGRLPLTMPYQHIVERTRRRVHVDDDDHIFRYYSGQLEKLMDAGVPVAVGDHETFYGLGMVWETMSLASAMKSNLTALKGATLNGAILNGLDDELGTLEPGKLADLIALDGNPLADIKMLAHTRYTMLNGVLYDARTLDEVWPEQKPLSPRPWWWNQAPAMRPGAVRSGGSPETPSTVKIPTPQP